MRSLCCCMADFLGFFVMYVPHITDKSLEDGNRGSDSASVASMLHRPSLSPAFQQPPSLRIGFPPGPDFTFTQLRYSLERKA